jgi:hypothetical protein
MSNSGALVPIDYQSGKLFFCHNTGVDVQKLQLFDERHGWKWEKSIQTISGQGRSEKQLRGKAAVRTWLGTMIVHNEKYHMTMTLKKFKGGQTDQSDSGAVENFGVDKTELIFRVDESFYDDANMPERARAILMEWTMQYADHPVPNIDQVFQRAYAVVQALNCGNQLSVKAKNLLVDQTGGLGLVNLEKSYSRGSYKQTDTQYYDYIAERTEPGAVSYPTPPEEPERDYFTRPARIPSLSSHTAPPPPPTLQLLFPDTPTQTPSFAQPADDATHKKWTTSTRTN